MTDQHQYKTASGRIWIIRGRLIYGADAEVATWVNERLGGGTVDTPFIGIGVLHHQCRAQEVNEHDLPYQLVAGAYFYNEHLDGSASDIEAAVAADDIAAGDREVVRQVLSYPFGERRHRRITVQVEASNERAIRQAQKMGFRIEGRKRKMAGPNEDVIIMGLLPEECPFWSGGERNEEAA